MKSAFGHPVIPTGAARSVAEWRDLVITASADRTRSLGCARDDGSLQEIPESPEESVPIQQGRHLRRFLMSHPNAPAARRRPISSVPYPSSARISSVCAPWAGPAPAGAGSAANDRRIGAEIERGISSTVV